MKTIEGDIVKALVLSGGSGSRLRPLTHTRSKHLLPLANRPILHHVLDNIAQSGLHDVVILHGMNGQEIKNSVGNGASWGLTVSYVLQEQPLGLAHAVQTAHPMLDDEPFVMILGDNILPNGIKPYLDNFCKLQPDAMVLLHPVPNPQDFGIAELDGQRVLRLIEKPKNPPSNLALMGIYFLSPEIHPSIQRIKPSARGELEITDAIQDLLERGYRVEARIVNEAWYDTGTPENLLKANQELLTKITPAFNGTVDSDSAIIGSVVVGPHAMIKHSRIIGPVMIGEDSLISDATIGPWTSIGDNVRITGSSITNSIILRECRIEDMNCADCLLGEGTTLSKGAGSLSSITIHCGDHSRIALPGLSAKR